jgi:hypothetical protein
MMSPCKPQYLTGNEVFETSPFVVPKRNMKGSAVQCWQMFNDFLEDTLHGISVSDDR